ncbi:F15O4.24 [Arabidopsis thaliana]|uniref:F15O4.24 n=1 Tax=Arabidopsis thaliana TaxID=3702 RepID=Q9LQG1_ARATH|nr:F15O4.24 [Arabidopsis thaliana]
MNPKNLWNPMIKVVGALHFTTRQKKFGYSLILIHYRNLWNPVIEVIFFLEISKHQFFQNWRC